MGAEELSNCKNCGAVLPAITNQSVKCSYCSTVYAPKQPENIFPDKKIEGVFSTAIENAVFDTLKNEFSGTEQSGYGNISVQIKHITLENEEAEQEFLQNYMNIVSENNESQIIQPQKRQVKTYQKNSGATRVLVIGFALIIIAIFVYILKKLL